MSVATRRSILDDARARAAGFFCFNGICKAAGLAILLASAIQGLRSKPPTFDFCQYYMAGLIARHGAWESLYPIPRAGVDLHPGYPKASAMRPGYAALAEAAGVDDNARFVQPPPLALLLLPLSFFDYRTGNGVWVVAMSACLWLAALQSARIHRILSGRPSRAEGLLVLLIACAPLCRQAVRIGNISPFVGLCVGAAALGLVGDGPVRGALGLTLGALGKYATVVLVPLFVLARRWRVLALSAAALLLIVVATLAVSGRRPFVTFAREMVPTFTRTDEDPRNITVKGFLYRWYGRDRVPRGVEGAVRAAELALVVLGAAGLLRNLRGLPDDPARLLAAALAMLGGFLIFSPIAWGHYLVYLIPFWGYLLWEGARSLWARAVVAVALPLMWAPRDAIQSLSVFETVQLPVLAQSTELCALLAVVVLAIARLNGAGLRPGPAPAAPAPAPDPAP